MYKQSEVDQALEDLQYVKKRLAVLAEKQPVATRRTYTEFVEIIDTDIAATYAAGENPKLTIDYQSGS